MRLFKAVLVDQPDAEPIRARGLTALMAALAPFGPRAQVKSIRVALANGRGMTKITSAMGHIAIGYDVEAESAEHVAVTRAFNRVFYGKVYVQQYLNDKDATEIAVTVLEGNGLKDLLFKSAVFANEKLGGLPDDFNEAAVDERAPNIHAQIARNKAKGSDYANVFFPQIDAKPFELRGGRYRICISVGVDGNPFEPKAPEGSVRGGLKRVSLSKDGD